MYAFNHDIELKESIIKLTREIPNNCFEPVMLSWSGERGSFIGNLLKSTDLSEWESHYGLPQWFALAIDALCAKAGGYDQEEISSATSREIGAMLLEAVPIGKNILQDAQSFLSYLLGNDESGILKIAADKVLKDAIVQVVGMHTITATSTLSSNDDWKQIRRFIGKSASSLSDPIDQLICSCVEAACWNVANSPTVVSDTLTCWFQIHEQKTVIDYGWSEKDDEQVRARLDSLFNEYKKTVPEDEINVFDLYEQHFPIESARTRGMFASIKNQRSLILKKCTEAFCQYLRTESND